MCSSPRCRHLPAELGEQFWCVCSFYSLFFIRAVLTVLEKLCFRFCKSVCTTGICSVRYQDSRFMGAMKFNIEKFTGENNFGLWRIKMKVFLVHQGLEDALAGVKATLNSSDMKQKITVSKGNSGNGDLMFTRGRTDYRDHNFTRERARTDLDQNTRVDFHTLCKAKQYEWSGQRLCQCPPDVGQSLAGLDKQILCLCAFVLPVLRVIFSASIHILVVSFFVPCFRLRLRFSFFLAFAFFIFVVSLSIQLNFRGFNF